MLLVLHGCGNDAPPAAVRAARQSLQLGHPQRAIDELTGATDIADVRYFRGLALQELGQPVAARAEFQAALQLGDSPRSEAALLKLRLFQRDLSAARELIQLEDTHSSSAAVRLASVYAYEALGTRLTAEGKPQAAASHRQRAKSALKTALSLSAAIPEFHTVLLDFAQHYGFHQPALRLVRALKELDPKNDLLTKQEVTLLLSLRQIATARTLAYRIYFDDPHDVTGAELYASVLAQSPADKEFDRDFRMLRKEFPGHLSLIAHHATHLARTKRLTSACLVLSTALKQQKRSRERWPLIRAAITLPLQAGVPGLAQEQLDLYRGEVPEEELVIFYEGQLLHLQGKHQEALQKMSTVLRMRAELDHRHDPLVSDAIHWIQKIRRSQDRSASSRTNRPPTPLR